MKRKTAKQLGITQGDYIILLGIRTALDEGLLAWHPQFGVPGTSTTPNGPVFNMANVLITARDATHCGTIGCIGGYMGLANGQGGMGIAHYLVGGGVNGANLPAAYTRLERLFCPIDEHGTSLNYDPIKPKDAVVALDRFFAGAAFPWAPYIKRRRAAEKRKVAARKGKRKAR